MATRDWSTLGAAQQKRYLNASVNRGLTAAQIRAHYESGASLKDWRGHAPRPVSEKRWTALRAAAKRAELWRDVDDTNQTIEKLFNLGFSYEWILHALQEKANSRSTFRTALMKALRKNNPRADAGYNPGRARYKKRTPHAPRELFFYH